jgi:hypothetical protein
MTAVLVLQSKVPPYATFGTSLSKNSLGASEKYLTCDDNAILISFSKQR